MTRPVPVPAPQAARELGRHPATVSRWLAAGAPVVRPGRRGRGGSALVDVEQLRQWYAASRGHDQRAEDLGDWREHVEAELLQFFVLPERDGKTRWQLFGLDERQAAAVVVAIALQLLGDELSPEMLQMRARISGSR